MYNEYSLRRTCAWLLSLSQNAAARSPIYETQIPNQIPQKRNGASIERTPSNSMQNSMQYLRVPAGGVHCVHPRRGPT